MNSPGGRRATTAGTTGRRQTAKTKQVEVELKNQEPEAAIEKDPQIVAKEEELEAVVCEFKNLDFQALKKDLGSKLNTEIATLEKQQTSHKNDAKKTLDDISKLQGDHKTLQKENRRTNDQRRQDMEKLEQNNTGFDKYMTDSNGEKKQLRDKISDLEETLRKIRHQLGETSLDNTNMTTQLDAEDNLRKEKGQQEHKAVKTVNVDLRDQIQRLEEDVVDEKALKKNAEDHLADLKQKHTAATKHFDGLRKAAEDGKRAAETELNNLKQDLNKQRTTNTGLKKNIEDNEREIQRLESAISQAKHDLQDSIDRNERQIQEFERQRDIHEEDIKKTSEELTKLNHQINDLKNETEKAKKEIEILTSEKDKLNGQEYERKVSELEKHIEDSERKTRDLENEIQQMSDYWTQLHDKTTRDTENQIRKQENEDHVKRIEKNILDINEKNQQLNKLQAERDQLKRDISDEDSAAKDKNVADKKAKLDQLNKDIDGVLTDKNQIYDDLAANTKNLVAKDDEIQKNSAEIAQVTVELEAQKKELLQKQKIAEDLRKEIEEKKAKIAELQDILAQKRSFIEELEQKLKDKEAELEELDQLIADKDALIQDLQSQVDALEEAKQKPPTPPPEPKKEPPKDINYKAKTGDLVDEMLAQYLNLANCPVPIKRLGDGYYMFGTKKIYAKILNGKLVIRVGGGYMIIEEFIATYAEAELAKLQQRAAKGEDPFEGQSSPKQQMGFGSKGGSPRASDTSPKSGRSPGRRSLTGK